MHKSVYLERWYFSRDKWCTLLNNLLHYQCNEQLKSMHRGHLNGVSLLKLCFRNDWEPWLSIRLPEHDLDKEDMNLHANAEGESSVGLILRQRSNFDCRRHISCWRRREWIWKRARVIPCAVGREGFGSWWIYINVSFKIYLNKSINSYYSIHRRMAVVAPDNMCGILYWLYLWYTLYFASLLCHNVSCQNSEPVI